MKNAALPAVFLGVFAAALFALFLFAFALAGTPSGIALAEAHTQASTTSSASSSATATGQNDTGGASSSASSTAGATASVTSEPPIDHGSGGVITVCKVIADGEGNAFTGPMPGETNFTVALFEGDPPMDLSQMTPVATALFSTALFDPNTDIFPNLPGDDAECVTYRDLPLGSYLYAPETIDPKDSDSDLTWLDPRYHDQFSERAISLADFSGYDHALFTADSSDDGGRNKNADGHIVLTEQRPHRQLIVLNTVEQADREGRTAIIHASKVVCQEEADLPDWGGGGPDITARTALDWVAQHNHCALESGWQFQWGDQNATDPGNDFYGAAGDGWHTFGPTNEEGVATTTVALEEGLEHLWVREVLKDGYVPFAGAINGEAAASAEMYCHTDVLNFDNYDFIDAPEADAAYYCAAFNVPVLPPEEPEEPERPEPEDPYGPYCGDGRVNQEWEQCDGSDAGPFGSCLATCQWEEYPQCSDLTLARVVVEDVRNWGGGDATSDVFVGSAAAAIPSGTWFPLYWNGAYITDPDMSTAGYEDVPGLAVERQKGAVRLLLYGSQDDGSKEHANGIIEFSPVSAEDLASDTANNNKLEKGFDGSGADAYHASDDEVWITAAGSSGFWLTVTTADDGFITFYDDVPSCAAPEEPATLSVCKVVIDEENNIVVDPGKMPTGSFLVNIATATTTASTTIETASFGPESFTPNRSIVSSAPDAECASYNLPYGDYYYTEEVTTGSQWEAVGYNDQYSTPVNNIPDFFAYSPELFNGDPADDDARNRNADGHIVLDSYREKRTLVILNRYVDEPLWQCSDGIDNDGDGVFDDQDPACHADGDSENPDSYDPEIDSENQKPTITLIGSATTTVTIGAGFTDPGATAHDPEDGDITADIAVGGDTISTTTPAGTYTITYNVTDSEGLAADEAARTVIVEEEEDDGDGNGGGSGGNGGNGGGGGGSGTPVCGDNKDNDGDGLVDEDDTACHTDGDPNNTESYVAEITSENAQPVITVTGDNPFELNVGDPFTDPGATAHDPEDGDITADIAVGGDTISTTTPDGTYTITYNVTDSEGLAADEAARTVEVSDSLSGGGSGSGTQAPVPDGGALALEPSPEGDASTAAQCDYLNDYLRRGADNDPEEVRKLQIFLRDYEAFSSLSVTGIFDDATFDAVSAFQLRHAEDVLEPWGIAAPTGYVYITTKNKINETYCETEIGFTTAEQSEIDEFLRTPPDLRGEEVGLSEREGGLAVSDASSATTTGERGGAVKDRLAGVRNIAASVFALPESFGEFYDCLIDLILIVLAITILWLLAKEHLLYRHRVSTKKIEGQDRALFFIAATLLAALLAGAFGPACTVLPLVIIAVAIAGIFFYQKKRGGIAQISVHRTKSGDK